MKDLLILKKKTSRTGEDLLPNIQHAVGQRQGNRKCVCKY